MWCLTGPPMRSFTLGICTDNLSPSDGDHRSGDRAPGPKPHGGLPGLAAAKPLPRKAVSEARQRAEWLFRAVPVNWKGDGSATP